MQLIRDRNILKNVHQFSKQKKIKLYLVGGYLRDIILNRQRDNPDIDFCLKKGAIRFARELTRQIRAGFVVLDREHESCRLVKKIKGKIYTLDFTDFRGKTLEEDLLHRDFTINTLALDLDDLKAAEKEFDKVIIDPFSGRKDLALKIIRLANKSALDEDPLRILRALSLSAIFGFKIDKNTISLMQRKRKKISGVSWERIREELFKIFDTPVAFDYVSWMDKLKILNVVIPEIEIMRGIGQGPYHHLDVWQHSLETLRQLEELLKQLKNNKEIKSYLDEVISSERRRLTLLKLGALLHDIGKPKAIRHEKGKTIFHGHERIGLEISQIIGRRLRLSCDETGSLCRMILWHLRPGYLADNPEPTARAIFRYFRDTKEDAVSILLLSLADQRATKGRLTTEASRSQHEKVCFGLIKEYFRRKKEKKPARLINGDILMRKFKLKPSPLIGRLLSEIEELQAIGRVKTKAEALKAAAKLLRSER